MCYYPHVYTPCESTLCLTVLGGVTVEANELVVAKMQGSLSFTRQTEIVKLKA